MPLTSINEARDLAQDLIRRYSAWTRNEAESVVNAANGSAPSSSAVRQFGEKALRFAQEASSMLESSGAQSLSADERSDLLQIKEEGAIAAEEAADESDPEVIFAQASLDKRIRMTERMPITHEAREALRARIRLERRGQPASPFKKPGASGAPIKK